MGSGAGVWTFPERFAKEKRMPWVSVKLRSKVSRLQRNRLTNSLEKLLSHWFLSLPETSLGEAFIDRTKSAY